MTRNSGKTKSRGEILAASRPQQTVKATQGSNEEQAGSPIRTATQRVGNRQGTQEKDCEDPISPLRNKASNWKANPLPKADSPSHSPSHNKHTSKNFANSSSSSSSALIGYASTGSSTKNSTPASASTHHSALSRSASTGSSQKYSSPASSSSNPLSLIRSASTGSTQKKTTPTPTSSAPNRASLAHANSASKDRDPKHNSVHMEHSSSSSNSTTKKKNYEQRRSPTNSEVDTPEELDPESEDYGNGSSKAENANEVHSTTDRHKHNLSHSPSITSESRTSNKKRRQQQLDSESDDADELQTSIEESRRSSSKTSRKSHESKKMKTSFNQTAIGTLYYMVMVYNPHYSPHVVYIKGQCSIRIRAKL
jgi:hypothetical protein